MNHLAVSLYPLLLGNSKLQPVTPPPQIYIDPYLNMQPVWPEKGGTRTCPLPKLYQSMCPQHGGLPWQGESPGKVLPVCFHVDENKSIFGQGTNRNPEAPLKIKAPLDTDHMHE